MYKFCSNHEKIYDLRMKKQAEMEAQRQSAKHVPETLTNDNHESGKTSN